MESKAIKCETQRTDASAYRLGFVAATAVASSVACASPAEGWLTLTEVTASAATDPSHRIKTRRQLTKGPDKWCLSGNSATAVAWWVVRAFALISDSEEAGGKNTHTLNSDSHRKEARDGWLDGGVCVVCLCWRQCHPSKRRLFPGSQDSLGNMPTHAQAVSPLNVLVIKGRTSKILTIVICRCFHWTVRKRIKVITRTRLISYIKKEKQLKRKT